MEDSRTISTSTRRLALRVPVSRAATASLQTLYPPIICCATTSRLEATAARLSGDMVRARERIAVALQMLEAGLVPDEAGAIHEEAERIGSPS